MYIILLFVSQANYGRTVVQCQKYIRESMQVLFIYVNILLTFTLIAQNKIGKTDVSVILLKTYEFLKYYNNNYRPIYHLESYLFYLTSVIHGYTNSV